MTKDLQTNEGFLDMWSAFEKKCFNGSLTKDKVQYFTLNCRECENEFSHIFEHFHTRYQNEGKLKLFLDNQKNEWFQSVLSKSVGDISSVEKTKFMIYVVERYKAYIFDQNNPETLRNQYKTELGYCMDSMAHIVHHQEANHQRIENAKANNTMSSVHLMSYTALEK